MELNERVNSMPTKKVGTKRRKEEPVPTEARTSSFLHPDNIDPPVAHWRDGSKLSLDHYDESEEDF